MSPWTQYALPSTLLSAVKPCDCILVTAVCSSRARVMRSGASICASSSAGCSRLPGSLLIGYAAARMPMAKHAGRRKRPAMAVPAM